MYRLAYLILVPLGVFVSTVTTQELKTISNVQIKSVGDVLNIFWNVNPLHGNTSKPIQLYVKLCPLDDMLETQDGCQVNFTLCNGTYQRLPSVSGDISVQEEKLADYLRVDSVSIFTKAAGISSGWNETSGQFVCTVHNMNECKLAASGYPFIKGQILLIASTSEYEDKKILDIEQNTEPSKYLFQPYNVVVIENDNTTVMVKWKACASNKPSGFNITFQKDGGNALNCGTKILVDHFYSHDWEYLCKFSYLRPYTYYMVSVYAYKEIFSRSPDTKHRIPKTSWRSSAGIKKFRTHEQAPSSPPFFECIVCNETKLPNGSRNVQVRWKLPPKEMLNGVVRQTFLRYWEKSDFKSKRTVKTFQNTEKAILLKKNLEYFVQVKICTLENLCSSYSERKLIPKIPDKYVTITTVGKKDYSEILPVVLPIGLLLFCMVLILGILHYSKQRRHAAIKERGSLDDLKLEEAFSPDVVEGSFINESSDAKYFDVLPPLVPDGLVVEDVIESNNKV